MKKLIVPALAAAALLGTASAHAGNVQWSIGIQLPPVATVISNGPVYGPPPVIYAPPPVVYAPAPVVYAPRPVPRVVYADPYGYYPVAYGHPHWKHSKKRHHRHHDRWHHRHHDRDDD